jgi:hypothetical protein
VSPFWIIVWCAVIAELAIWGIALWVMAIRTLL